jgi:hypothetical protein
MTSNINISLIDENYPVAGQDNDSQGFRDNFNEIKSSLGTAKSEISALQTNSLLNADLATSLHPVINDLKGSSINNGFYNNFHGTSNIATVSGTTTINVSSASIHVFTLTGNSTFTFNNWPASTYYARVKVHLISDTVADRTASLFSVGGGIMHYDDNFPAPLTATADGKHTIIEAWSYNHGATVFVKYLGSF